MPASPQKHAAEPNSPVQQDAIDCDGRYVRDQLSGAVALSLEDLEKLTLAGRFPEARPHSRCGLSWNRKKIDAWAWGLRNSAKLANAVEVALGRRDDWWAK